MSALWPHPRREAPFDVVGLGECSLDHMALLEGWPAPGDKRRILTYARFPGGTVATALLALARLGLRTALVSSLGDDDDADAVLAPLSEAGVELSAVRRVPGARSRLAMVLVDQKTAERTVLWTRDEKLLLEVGSVPREAIVRGRALHVDATDPPLSVWAAGVAREAGMPSVLDVDAVVPGIEALLRAVDFPIVSRQFAENYFGGLEAALRGLAGLGARFPVVTLGDQGAIGGAGEATIVSPAFTVKARDATGAGDVFHAAFLAGLLEGRDARDILQMANGAAAMNCRELGAQGGLPTRTQLAEFLEGGEGGER